MERPELVEVKGGWMAIGPWCGVVAESRTEALKRFHEARARHAIILARPPASELQRLYAQSQTDAQA
jgi:hypothetical protein